MKGDYQKLLKKLTLFFISNPVLFNGQSYKKQKGLGTSNQSLFRLQNKFTKISILVKYYQTKFDGVIQIGSWVIPKITPLNLCKPIHDIINYSTSICSFESRKCGKEVEKSQILNISRTKRDFWIYKKHFSQFLKGYHMVKKYKFDKK